MKPSRFSAAASTTSTASRTAASRCRGTTVTQPIAPVSVSFSCVLCCEFVCCECVCLTCASHKQTRPGRARTAPCSWPRSAWSAAWAVRILVWVDHLMHTMHASFVFLFPECFVFIPGAFATVVLIRGTFDSEKEMKFDNVRFRLTIECPFVYLCAQARRSGG